MKKLKRIGILLLTVAVLAFIGYFIFTATNI